MSTIHTVPLPTFEALGVSEVAVSVVDAGAIAREWFDAFSNATATGSPTNVAALFTTFSPMWRDLLCLSWDFHTKTGVDSIHTFLSDHLASSGFSQLALQDNSISFQRLAPNLAWITGSFSFETTIGAGVGVFRLVPTPGDHWKAHTIFTSLESLKGFPARAGAQRETRAARYGSSSGAKEETHLSGSDQTPAVIIVGAGQAGLQVAAHLKALGVPTLLVEQNARVGDQWRKRYNALSLHSPVWCDHMPYMPFPATWPVYAPAARFADWLESYAQVLDLNVWTSCKVKRAVQDPITGQWKVTIKRPRELRDLTVNHIVFAHGSNGGTPRMPTYEGMDTFGGKILHSSQYTTASDHTGKKVVVIGAGTSAHDICADLARNGGDITMYQRNPCYIMSSEKGIPLALPAYKEDGPPIEVADRELASFPWHLALEMSKGLTAMTKALDKELLDGLNAAGYKTWDGPDGTGFAGLLYTRNGGYYPDVGSCQLIIDGKIKMKSDSPIKRFIKSGIEFEDGSVLAVDVIICATGFGDATGPIANICGKDVASQVKPLLGFDEEGEIPGLYRPSGVRNLWVHMGTIAMGRPYSKYIGLQIKAVEEGLVPVSAQSPVAAVIKGTAAEEKDVPDSPQSASTTGSRASRGPRKSRLSVFDFFRKSTN